MPHATPVTWRHCHMSYVARHMVYTGYVPHDTLYIPRATKDGNKPLCEHARTHERAREQGLEKKPSPVHRNPPDPAVKARD